MRCSRPRPPVTISYHFRDLSLKGITSYLKDISSDKISAILGRARQNSEIDDLHAGMIRGVIKFATTVPVWGSTFVDDDTEPSYAQIFPQELAQTTQSYFNQLLLAVEAACFFLHASSRLSVRQGSESLRLAIYDSSFRLMVGWLLQTVRTVLGEDNNTVTDDSLAALIQKRELEYGRSPTLLGSGWDDQDSAVWAAARLISDEIAVKSCFDRDGYSNHIILTQIVGTILMQELAAMDLASQIERIETLSEKRSITNIGTEGSLAEDFLASESLSQILVAETNRKLRNIITDVSVTFEDPNQDHSEK
jgi:hypothetical protein